MKRNLFSAFLSAVVCLSMSSAAMANGVGDNSPGSVGVLGDGSASASRSASLSSANLRSKNVSGSTSSVVVQNSTNYTGQTGAPSGYAGNTNIDARSAPSIALAPLYGGGARCPTVGLTGAGSATGGGGGAGISWYSTDCSTVEIAEYLRSIGRPDDGTALLAHHFPELEKVLASRQQQPAQSPVAGVPSKPIPGWCAKALQNHHMTEASAVYVHEQCG